jgi:hypothetical protein
VKDFHWGWLAAACAAIPLALWAALPDKSDPLRVDKMWIVPNAAKAGESVKVYVKGEWFAPVVKAVQFEQTTCDGTNQALPVAQHDIAFKRVGRLDKSEIDPVTRQDSGRPYVIPPCVKPGPFRVTTRIIMTRSWLFGTYDTEQPGGTFTGEVLPP